MRRSTKIKHTLRETLWPELIVFFVLIALVAIFGFQIWLLVLAVLSAGAVWRRAVLYDRNHPIG